MAGWPRTGCQASSAAAPRSRSATTARSRPGTGRQQVPRAGRRAPREDRARAVREACHTASNTGPGYGDPAGNPRLREVLAATCGGTSTLTVNGTNHRPPAITGGQGPSLTGH
jgi:DNA-binding transcriptional MocR family regulator